MGHLVPSDPADGLALLSERLQRDGYLWLKGLLPRDDVLAIRAYVFAAFADTGLLAPGSDPAIGIAGSAENADLSRRRLMEMVRSAAFEAFCLSPGLWRFMDGLLGGLSYLHKRKLLRMTKPGQAFSTPAHYDLVYLRGGTDRIVTAWIPIGDTPAIMGGLCYLEGSHAEGRRLEAKFAADNADMDAAMRISAYNRNMGEGGWISKDLPAMAERFDARWLIADYEVGDVVLHSPYMIHAATANDDPDGRIRLSCDIRYQNVRDEIDARWSNHWSLDDML
ncbi:phytanoyl-CoA dioxygenase family protein [Kaistia algarum]|nr:phytanoyl-CoA dioxygenase family protein [Kaistia algarum]MCX5514864.1 phytanoyl-CoA dioxygenase family protein [Kaistia algarum]